MPNAAGKGVTDGFMTGPAGLMDTLAAALRGATAQGLGLPGDLETLGRWGLNKLAPPGDTGVSPEPFLPNTERFSKEILPPLNPITGGNWNQVETLGQFLPAPTVLAAVPKAMQSAGQLASVLRAGARGAEHDPGRRTALKGMAGAAALPTAMIAALRGGEDVARTAATKGGSKAAAKIFTHTSEHVDDFLGKYHGNDMGVQLAEYIDDVPKLMTQINKQFGHLPPDKFQEGLHKAMDVTAETFNGPIWFKGYPKTPAGAELAAKDIVNGKVLEWEKIGSRGETVNWAGKLNQVEHPTLKLLGYN